VQERSRRHLSVDNAQRADGEYERNANAGGRHAQVGERRAEKPDAAARPMRLSELRGKAGHLFLLAAMRLDDENAINLFLRRQLRQVQLSSQRMGGRPHRRPNAFDQLALQLDSREDNRQAVVSRQHLGRGREVFGRIAP
jgi:hypothetical protein